MNEMRKLMEAVSQHQFGAPIKVKKSFFEYTEDEYGPDFTGHFSEYEEMSRDLMEQMAEAVSPHGLRFYYADNGSDGFIWDIRK